MTITEWDWYDGVDEAYGTCHGTLPDGRRIDLQCSFWGQWIVTVSSATCAEGKSEDDDAGMRAAEQAARKLAADLAERERAR